MSNELEKEIYKRLCEDPAEATKLIVAVLLRVCKNTNANVLQIVGSDKDDEAKDNFGLFFINDNDKKIKKVKKVLDKEG